MLLLEYFCTSALGYPAAVISDCNWLSLTDLTNAVWIRVPDLKSMPKFRPLPPIASAPIIRMQPDSEKNQREAPMKSNVHLRVRLLAPSSAGWATAREPTHRARPGSPAPR